MINSLITSQTRIKLLKKFFLNSSTRAHLRGLEAEFRESTNGIRVELNRLEKADLLKSSREGNKKIYSANPDHPLFREIHNIILKDTGIDRVIEKVAYRIGNLMTVYLTGDLAQGRDNNVIELVMVGTDIDHKYLASKVEQAKILTGRNVRCSVLDPDEAKTVLKDKGPCDMLLLWESVIGEKGVNY